MYKFSHLVEKMMRRTPHCALAPIATQTEAAAAAAATVATSTNSKPAGVAATAVDELLLVRKGFHSRPSLR